MIVILSDEPKIKYISTTLQTLLNGYLFDNVILISENNVEVIIIIHWSCKNIYEN
jgi:hypothetical protein